MFSTISSKLIGGRRDLNLNQEISSRSWHKAFVSRSVWFCLFLPLFYCSLESIRLRSIIQLNKVTSRWNLNLTKVVTSTISFHLKLLTSDPLKKRRKTHSNHSLFLQIRKWTCRIYSACNSPPTLKAIGWFQTQVCVNLRMILNLSVRLLRLSSSWQASGSLSGSSLSITKKLQASMRLCWISKSSNHS